MAHESEVVGGNRISAIKGGMTGEHSFAECRYSYKYIVLNADDEITVGGSGAWTVFFYQAYENSVILIDSEMKLSGGDSLQIENKTAHLKALDGKIEFLVSGVKNCESIDAVFEVTRKGDHYKVIKPWGHEIWFNGEHALYCLKEVFVTAGNRTSLQYHHKKEETNVIISGNAKLFYKENSNKPNDDVTPSDLGSRILNPISIVHIIPGVLHRIEALSDVMIYESSTPFLDDVIRVQDDSNRDDGRIHTEHKS